MRYVGRDGSIVLSGLCACMLASIVSRAETDEPIEIPLIAKFHYTDPTGPARTRTDPRGPAQTRTDRH